MRKMTSLLAPLSKPLTSVLVTGMAYECKDGRFAAVAWDAADVMGKRQKSYYATWDEARNAARTFALEFLGSRAYKPGYVNGRGRYTINLWS
jgi:hypothetical protein